MSTKKKPSNTKDALAKGAEEIRKLATKSAPKKPAAKKATPKKTIAELNAEANGALAVIPPGVVESTEEIKTLLKKHVVFADDLTSLRVKDETEIGEFLPIYDFVRDNAAKAKDTADKWQFVEGDLFNEGRRLFGKDFQTLMAKEGRPVSTLKKLGSISANIDTALRNIHPKLDWSHVAEVAKVPSETVKREILETAAKKLEAGESVSVKDIRAEADKHKPKKDRSKKGKTPVVKYEMTIEEQLVYDDFAKAAEDLRAAASANKKQLRALFPKLTGKDKSAMRESLELVAELAGMV